MLTSNNGKQGAFVTRGLTSVAMHDAASHAPPTSAVEPSNTCTDFVLVGYAEESEAGVPLTEATTALLLRDETLTSKRTILQRSAVTLTSNNHAKTGHFVTDGLCSAPLTSKDVLWMEKVAECKPGSLFKSFADASRESPSPCEHPYEPTRRFVALSAARTERTRRGAKTSEHLEHLRRSDPLIRIEAWIDWSTLHEQVKASRAAHVHQQALIDRAVRAHARLTASALTSTFEPAAAFAASIKEGPPTKGKDVLAAHKAFKAEGSSARRHGADERAPWCLPGPTGSPSNNLKRRMHLGRLKSVDDVSTADERDGRGERVSSDSVMSMLHESSHPTTPLKGCVEPGAWVDSSWTPPATAPWEGHSWVDAPQKTSLVRPGAKGVVTPPMEIGEIGGEKVFAGERSPVSVVGLSGNAVEKAFPPLPQPERKSAFGLPPASSQGVDHALHEYKVVPPGPGWYSDS